MIDLADHTCMYAKPARISLQICSLSQISDLLKTYKSDRNMQDSLDCAPDIDECPSHCQD